MVQIVGITGDGGRFGGTWDMSSGSIGPVVPVSGFQSTYTNTTITPNATLTSTGPLHLISCVTSGTISKTGTGTVSASITVPQYVGSDTVLLAVMVLANSGLTQAQLETIMNGGTVADAHAVLIDVNLAGPTAVIGHYEGGALTTADSGAAVYGNKIYFDYNYGLSELQMAIGGTTYGPSSLNVGAIAADQDLVLITGLVSTSATVAFDAGLMTFNLNETDGGRTGFESAVNATLPAGSRDNDWYEVTAGGYFKGTTTVTGDFVKLIRQKSDTILVHYPNSGTDGKTVRNGSGAPSAGLGVDGDFYIDTTAHVIYGPKTAGAWGSGVSLIGPTGATGAAGSNGTNGLNADMTRTSTSSVVIGTGSKTLTYPSSNNLGWAVGTRLRATKSTDATVWMEGVATAVSSTSVTITVDAASSIGTTVTSWNIFISGDPGATQIVTWANLPAASSVTAGTIRMVSDYNYTEWYSDGTYWKPRGGRQRIYNTIISFSTTGSTAEVAAWTPTIPAGMLFPGCRISGELTCRKTGTAGTIAPRMRYNGAAGAMLSANLTLAAGTVGYAWGFSVPTGSVTAGTITLLQVVPQAIVVTGSTTVAATTATHTLANAVTLNVTVQLGSAADTALVDYGYVEICG